MDEVERTKRDLVIANRILAAEGVVDAYGHVSARHPLIKTQYLMSHSLSPEQVTLDDILTFAIDGTPIDDTRPPCLERYIHGAVYEARADVNFVVHAHAEATLPFGLATVPLVPVINAAADMGAIVPVWDIADSFGDETNLLVVNMQQGRDLARCLGAHSVALMRGHGFTAAGASIIQLVRMAVYLPRNARVQMEAIKLGGFKPLSAGEIKAFGKMDPHSSASMRGWRYWASKCGCSGLLDEVPLGDSKRSKPHCPSAD